jgi:hypothetical protein
MLPKVFSSLILLGAIASVAPAVASTPSPGTQPTSSIDVRDYCTVVLALKLQDHLHVTDAQRAHLEDMKTKLNAYLHNAAFNMRGTPTPGLVAARAETALSMVGKLVREELTPEQRASLIAMFDDKTLQPIRVGGQVETQAGYRGTVVISGINLSYTHFGESTTPAKTAATTMPTTQTATPDTAAPAVGSPRSRRRENHVDVAAAIVRLKSENMPGQVAGAADLARATPDEVNRPKVLELLRPAVKDPVDEQWSWFVAAYCVWADAGELETVKGILKSAETNKRAHQGSEAAAYACCALLRLDPATAVEQINQRLGDTSFRGRLSIAVHRLSLADGPAQSRAVDVYNQLVKNSGKIVLTP